MCHSKYRALWYRLHGKPFGNSPKAGVSCRRKRPPPSPTPYQNKLMHNHQFHVRDEAVKTGGFHCNNSGLMVRLPLILSFSNRFSLAWTTASVRTMTCWFFCRSC